MLSNWGTIVGVTGLGLFLLLYAKKVQGSMADPLQPLKPFKGTPTAEMQAWAGSIVNDPTAKFGDVFSRNFGGRAVLARVEHHTWTIKNGIKTSGNFKGVTLYEA